MAQGSRCLYCNTVNKLCPWGPRREFTWKRPVLFFLAIFFIAALGTLIWFLRRGSFAYYILVPMVALVIYSAVGLLVSNRGCRACVARMLGDLGE